MAALQKIKIYILKYIKIEQLFEIVILFHILFAAFK